jgi:hypothetical protein
MKVLASVKEYEIAAKVVDVDISEARNKDITKFNHAIRDRKVKFYRRLVMPQ